MAAIEDLKDVFRRWKYRLRNRWNYPKELERRVAIENYLLACSAGKRALPDAQTCRWLALRLGAPKEHWSDFLQGPAPEAPQTSSRMVYVAADPTQPGAAWAGCVDDPKYAADNAETVASWILKGASVMRVTSEKARDMMDKWERPSGDFSTRDVCALAPHEA